MCDERLQREVASHDRAFTESSRARVGRFYAITEKSKGHYRDTVLRHGSGRCVLEYGCGAGSQGHELARHGAQVVGIDIAEAAIELARQAAVDQGVSNRATFQVMDAEHLTFPEQHFDLVCGSGILHHLDLARALGEVARVLKAQGRAVFLEPLGHNPFINLFRRLTPHLRTRDEHALLVQDLELLGDFFGRVDTCHFHLSALLAIPFRRWPGFSLLLRSLEGLDDVLFRVPFLRKQAWIAVIELAQPKQASRHV